MAAPITIVGCGPGHPDYVTPAAARAVARSDVLVGAQRLLELFPDAPGERIAVTRSIDSLLDSLSDRAGTKAIAVLVTGDPGLFSLAKKVIERFGRERCVLIPGVSAVQVACARLGLDWEDTRMVTVHKGPPAPVEDAARELGRLANLAFFVGSSASMAWVQDVLSLLNPRRRIHVCQDLTLEGETISTPALEDLASLRVSSRTIVLAVNEERDS